jgi:hypothetical protein
MKPGAIQCADVTTPWSQWPTKSSFMSGYPPTGWTLSALGTLRGRKCRISTGTCSRVGSAPGTASRVKTR